MKTVYHEIVPQKTAIVVHDLVNFFINPAGATYDPHVENVKDKIQELLKAARNAGIDVIFIAPDPVGHADWGPNATDVPTAFGPFGSDVVVRKTRYGGFHGSNLEEHLHETGKDRIILCGLSLAGGVDPTLRSAFNRDFKVILATDSSLTRPMEDLGWGALSREQVEQVYYTVYAQKFARVATTNEIIGEISEKNIAV